MFEQHREKGRFVPVVPRNVQNTPGVSPRDTFSQNVKKHTKMKYDIHQEDTEMKEEKKMKGPDPCWKGYEMIGKKMKNGRSVPNCVPVKEDKDNLEYADGDMSIHQLKQIKAHADWILEMLKPDTDMPEWVQAKITLAADYLSTACDYLHVEMNEETENINESDLPTTKAKEKVVTVRHKTSGKELDVVHNAVEKYKKLGYEPVNEEADIVDEMAGANMDTRAVHKHLRKGGWNLTRTSGGHDVFTHQKSSQHIAVPRHRQLKAPLIRGILKTASSVSEDTGMKNGRPYIDPMRNHPGNASYMDNNYMRNHYEKRLKDIESGPYKRSKEVSQIKNKLAKLNKEGVEQIDEIMAGYSASKAVRNTMKDDKGLAAAHKKAQEISKREGVVQHIERNPKTGHHSVSDWYDSDRTVATYNNGKLREEVNESKTASIARGILMRKIDTMKLLKTPKPAQPKEPQKPAEPKMTTEELSRKAQIVKKAAKKVKDKFEADPVITQSAVKTVNGY